MVLTSCGSNFVVHTKAKQFYAEMDVQKWKGFAQIIFFSAVIAFQCPPINSIFIQVHVKCDRGEWEK